WERAALANALNAVLCVSIHNSSASDTAARGTETYYLPKQPNNLWLAQAVQQELVRTLGRRDRGVKSNNFWVLRDAEVPAILVEVSFLSNPEERALLADPEYRRKAGGHCPGHHPVLRAAGVGTGPGPQPSGLRGALAAGDGGTPQRIGSPEPSV